jgi:hypothetical protein
MKQSKVTLNRDSYASVLSMINSPDEENMVLGLSIVEETNQQKGLVYILMLKKVAQCKLQNWVTHAPKTCQWLRSIDASTETVLTYKKLLEIIIKNNVDQEQMQFYLDEFGAHLQKHITEMGYGLMDKLEVKVIFKNQDEQNRNISESLQRADA